MGIKRDLRELREMLQGTASEATATGNALRQNLIEQGNALDAQYRYLQKLELMLLGIRKDIAQATEGGTEQHTARKNQMDVLAAQIEAIELSPVITIHIDAEAIAGLVAVPMTGAQEHLRELEQLAQDTLEAAEGESDLWGSVEGYTVPRQGCSCLACTLKRADVAKGE